MDKSQEELEKEKARLEGIRKRREQELADRQVGGGTGKKAKELEENLAKGRQLDVQANKEGRGAKQEQPYKEQEQSGLEKLRAYEESVKAKVEERLQTQEKTQEMTRTR